MKQKIWVIALGLLLAAPCAAAADAQDGKDTVKAEMQFTKMKAKPVRPLGDYPCDGGSCVMTDACILWQYNHGTVRNEWVKECMRCNKRNTKEACTKGWDSVVHAGGKNDDFNI